MRIPILAVVDARETIAAVFDGVVGAEQSGEHPFYIRRIAAACAKMADGEFAQHFLEQIIQFTAGAEGIEVWLVFLFRGFEIEAVIVGVVEEIALDVPHFVIHLLPLQAWIYAHLDALGL